MLRRFAGIFSLVLMSLACLAPAQGYAHRKIDIRAGIVVIDSDQTSGFQSNNTPHAWFNLDSNPGVKPAGWNIYNPRATTQMTQAIYDRWAALETAAGGSAANIPAVNTNPPVQLNKASAPYWEVRLSALGDDQLSDYDVLLLSAYGFTSLNTAERDKLRKFVDGGGLLWIDIANTTDFSGTIANTFPAPFDKNTALGNQPLAYADVFNPLMTTPYSLSTSNLEAFRTDFTTTATQIDLTAHGLGTFAPIESWLQPDYGRFTFVAATATGPTIGTTKFGDGYVVVTTSGYAAALNRVRNGASYSVNKQFWAGDPAFDRSGELAGKFAVNMLHLTSGFSHPGGGTRNSHANPIDPYAPLLRRFSRGDTSILQQQTPVLYKGLLVVSSGDRVRVYDADPKTDLDGDGDPDDGFRDSSLGFDWDLLWESPSLGVTISSPVCGEVPSGRARADGSIISDQIFVVGTNGVLYMFDAFNLANGTIQPGPQAPFKQINPPTTSGYAGTDVPISPTYHDGLLYVPDLVSSAGNDIGQVWVADPVAEDAIQTAGVVWSAGGGPGLTLPPISGAATVGYIPVQDNSGGYDRVMYLPGKPTGSGITGTACISSLWLGVRGESPRPSAVDSTSVPMELKVVTRAATQGLGVYNGGNSLNGQGSLGVKLTIIKPNGDPFTDAEMAQYFKGTFTGTAGILTFDLNQPLPANFTTTYGVRLDYSIDWGTGSSASTTQILRGQLYLPDDPNVIATARRPIVGSIAMSARGTLYCVVSNQNDQNDNLAGGSFYAIREDIGRGGFRMLTRYDLYPPHTISLNQAAPVQHRATVTDTDGITLLQPTYLAGQFSRLTFVGSPSVRSGVVYVTASGRKTGGGFFQAFVPFTILMAFKAEPEAPEIRVGDIGDGFSLRQPDIVRSSNKSNPTAYNDLSPGQYSYDRSEGVIRLDNLMATTRGPVANAFSTSQPVIIRRLNQPDQLIEPDELGSKWSPLLWYSVMHGVQATAGPLTMGDSVFVPGSSILANLDLLQAVPPQFVLTGLIIGWSTDISPTDAYLISDTERPWLHQLYQLKVPAVGGPTANPDLLWPQMRDMRDFEDYLVRIRQTRTGKSTAAYGLVGGEGVLGAWGDQGVYAFSRSDFLVADEGRLSRFDASGNPIWSSDASASSGSADVGNVGGIQPLLRPTRAYPIGEGDIIVADPSANRVARIDLAGRELRSISSFKLDTTNVPTGYKTNESLKLNAPRDVALFTTFEVGGTQLWVHYLIADSGHRRLVEIADKYTVNANRRVTGVVTVGGQRQIGVLVWHSPASVSGKNFEYNSVARVYDNSSGRYYYVSGIGSASPTRVNTGLDTPSGTVANQREAATGNGGILVFDPTTPSRNVVISQVFVPAVPADAYWNFATGTFQSVPVPAHTQAISNLSSVTARVINDPTNGPMISLMYTDASGVYEIVPNTAQNRWDVRWMLPNQAYQAIRRLVANAPSANSAKSLRATYARRLDDGDVLIVNGYVGTTRGGGDFKGEVLQVNGDFDSSPTGTGFDWGKKNLGFDLKTIVFQLPPIDGVRGLVNPVFADRR